MMRDYFPRIRKPINLLTSLVRREVGGCKDGASGKPTKARLQQTALKFNTQNRKIEEKSPCGIYEAYRYDARMAVDCLQASDLPL